MLNKNNKYQIIIIICLWVICATAYAITERSQLWTDIELHGDLFNLPKLLYEINTQSRFNHDPDEFYLAHINGELGYQLFPTVSLWLGYQWTSRDRLSSRSNQQNRVWQQFLWQIFQNDCVDMAARTRLEERVQVGEAQWNDRFRQRLTIKFPKLILNKFTPVLWEEVFFNLTKPSWISNNWFDQNRAFAGVDIPTSKNTYLEVGYLNRYQYKTTSPDEEDNIVYVSFDIKT